MSLWSYKGKEALDVYFSSAKVQHISFKTKHFVQKDIRD